MEARLSEYRHSCSQWSVESQAVQESQNGRNIEDWNQECKCHPESFLSFSRNNLSRQPMPQKYGSSPMVSMLEFRN